MGLFSSGINKDIAGKFDPVNAGYGRLASDFGAQAGGASDRSGALWGQQGDLYSKIGGMLESGAFDTPGRAARAVDYGNMTGDMDWWTRLRGGEGTTRLKDTAGNDITSYSEIANQGMMTPEQKYAMRERPASQARSATSSFMDEMRRGGVSGWGGGGPASALAAQKNLLSSLRSGNLEAESSIASMTNDDRKWGYGQMEGAQGQRQSLDQQMRAEREAARNSARQGQKAGLGDWLTYLNADPRGSALDWSKQTTNNLAGQGSALSGWGGNIQAQMGMAKEAPQFGQIMQGVGSLAGAALGTGGIGQFLNKVPK